MKKISVVIACLCLSACDVPAPLENAVDSIKKMMGMAFQPKATPSPSPAQNAEASAVKANAELLAEMYQVTFNQKEIEDQAQFSSLVSSLNQGASLEGIYRGLVMGSRYRVLESKAKAASPDAIKVFAVEMSELQSAMKNPTHFNKDTAKQFPSIDFPEGADDSTPDSYTFGETKDENGAEVKKDKTQVAEELLQNFIGATPFTLKRVLAEEVMKKIDEMKDSPADLAQWYAGLVVHLSSANTDFGLPQRNSSDFDFHSRFARTMSVDRVKWEVLNRYHRIINRIQ
jgi:hypothetical protein